MQTKLPVIVDEHPGIIIFFTSGGNPFDILQWPEFQTSL